MTTSTDIDLSLSALIDVLSEIHPFHAPTTQAYGMLQKLSDRVFSTSEFNSTDHKLCDAAPFGEIVFPLVKMVAVSSVDIFSSINELIIFAFYWVNRHRYKKVADIGANIGLHTILMSRLGWNVKAFEPDQVHLDLLRR